MKNLFLVLSLVLFALCLNAETGHNLWLRNTKANPINIECKKSSPMLNIAKLELKQGWQGEAGASVSLVIKKNKSITGDGFIISKQGIEANNENGILYGVYELLRRQQTGTPIGEELCNPSFDLRLLNHWDNLDGSVERGYAGKSIFWRDGDNALTVTEKDKSLWHEYARANASIGINGSVLNNVNASPNMLTPELLNRVKEIADVLRPYGIKAYISINFSSPAIIGRLPTSDPLDQAVIKWWNDKAKEIYRLIPDLGGFVVKANSEGQPGPQDFGRTHADGANMLADALNPFGGIIMWRAFVYVTSDEDRAKQAYSEFMPFDGKFRDNVIVQVKNGPIDFQPREPFSPLFGAMQKTSIMAELQITQEYLGHSAHLAYLAPMWAEFLNSDTYQKGEGSTVVRCTNGSIFPQKLSAIAGVANIGLDENWCGHLFGQSNWYAYGRLAWNSSMTSEQIADEWIKLTFGGELSDGKNSKEVYKAEWDANFLSPVKQMMLNSREAVVNYMMPLGLHHIFSADHHYGPGPWWAPASWRKDWTPPYYHNASESGIGFDRTSTGSNAAAQYQQKLNSIFADPASCPEIFLLWFHHLPWDYQMKNGRTLWDEMCYKYDEGVQQVREFQKTWDKAGAYVDAGRFNHVQSKLRLQSVNALVWKDACLLYFQQFSKLPIPFDLERPMNNLNDLIEKDRKTR
ncbi:MAG TPA: alpha-glucuronidase [Prolixibacteraceae bacterium]|nr:alpha-glucuronidase [Prolixibacteraceae bacterium]